eukprot:Skav201694  [mRNA]  locus=scaffold641:809790:824083:- [translate_table: standard]
MAFHVDVLVGSPGQLQSVIVDTGSARTAFPCTTCGDGCGKHMDPPFDPATSSTFRLRSRLWLQCGETGCESCSNGKCIYNVKYAEGRAGGITRLDRGRAVGAEANQKGPVKMGCHSRETKLFRNQEPTGIMGLNEGGWNILEYHKAENTWCYAFFSSSRHILGASFMLDHAIIFDREEKKSLGTAIRCDTPPCVAILFLE